MDPTRGAASDGKTEASSFGVATSLDFDDIEGRMPSFESGMNGAATFGIDPLFDPRRLESWDFGGEACAFATVVGGVSARAGARSVALRWVSVVLWRLAVAATLCGSGMKRR